MGLFQKITHFAAGIDSETMMNCSSAEKNKYAILGTLVYIPLVTGMVAMAFVGSYYTSNVFILAAICLVWGGVVMVIERALISGLRPHTWSWAVPVRFILAIAMSCIITELIMLFCFKADINQRIAEINAFQTEQMYATGNSRVEELKAELAERKKILDEKERAYLDEIDGRNGTGIHGYGPSAKAKEVALNQERAYYEDAKQRLEAEIDAASDRRDENVGKLAEEQNPGLLQCIKVLYVLSSEDRNVKTALWIVHLFFLCVEMMPLFVKLSYPGTQYYDVLDMQDTQKLEALKLTMDDNREMMRLSSKCAITQQEIALKNKMTRLACQEVADNATIQAKTLCETTQSLDELEHDYNHLSEPRASKLKEEIARIYEEYLHKAAAIVMN